MPKRNWSWSWVLKPKSEFTKCERWDLQRGSSKSAAVAATVFCNFDVIGYPWFIWDRWGTGGQNSHAKTIDHAKSEAWLAAIQWNKFRRLKEEYDPAQNNLKGTSIYLRGMAIELTESEVAYLRAILK